MIYSSGLLTSAISIAAADPDPATFQADKERHIAIILERIQVAQKNLSCVQASQDHAALKACDVPVNQDKVVSEPQVKAPVVEKNEKKTQKDPKNKGK